MLNIHPDYQFTDADYAKAVDLDWLEFAENPRDLLPAEQEFVFVLMNAADIMKAATGEWPTYGEVQAALAAQEQKQNATWEKAHAAEEAEWMAQHAKDVAARNQKQ